jgi:hypothetical protein
MNPAKPIRHAKLESLSDLADIHYKLAALASLMEACGQTMEGEQVASVGALIAEQVRRLERLMSRLDKATRP